MIRYVSPWGRHCVFNGLARLLVSPFFFSCLAVVPFSLKTWKKLVSITKILVQIADGSFGCMSAFVHFEKNFIATPQKDGLIWDLKKTLSWEQSAISGQWCAFQPEVHKINIGEIHLHVSNLY